jgi:hypothetical protein
LDGGAHLSLGGARRPNGRGRQSPLRKGATRSSTCRRRSPTTFRRTRRSSPPRWTVPLNKTMPTTKKPFPTSCTTWTIALGLVGHPPPPRCRHGPASVVQNPGPVQDWPRPTTIDGRGCTRWCGTSKTLWMTPRLASSLGATCCWQSSFGRRGSLPPPRGRHGPGPVGTGRTSRGVDRGGTGDNQCLCVGCGRAASVGCMLAHMTRGYQSRYYICYYLEIAILLIQLSSNNIVT